MQNLTPASRTSFFKLVQDFIKDTLGFPLEKKDSTGLELISSESLQKELFKKCPTLAINKELFPIEAALLNPPSAKSIKGKEANPALIAVQPVESSVNEDTQEDGKTSSETAFVSMNITFFINTKNFFLLTLESIFPALKNKLEFSTSLQILKELQALCDNRDPAFTNLELLKIISFLVNYNFVLSKEAKLISPNLEQEQLEKDKFIAENEKNPEKLENESPLKDDVYQAPNTEIPKQIKEAVIKSFQLDLDQEERLAEKRKRARERDNEP